MQTPPIDRQVAVLAGRQHGVVDCTQLRALGIRRGGVAYRVRRGRLHPMHRGVYAVGHSVVGREGRWMAAVLAVGPGAVLSHRSAAALLGLRDTSRSAIDVTTPHKAHSRDGIEVHRTSHLPREDVTRIRGIPCTTVPRTLIDLAEFLTQHEIERVLERADINRQFDLRAVNDAIRRHRTRTGAATLRRVLDGYDARMRFATTELERRFLGLCMRFELPRPQLNVPISLPDGGIATVDALWRRERLVLETDGRETHDTHLACERDRHRDTQLMLVGYRVARFTWLQVTREPAAVAATVHRLLSNGATGFL
jgi:predicted transcriptional regulator of viral defense system